MGYMLAHHMIETGEARQTAIVVHGIMGSSRNWRSFIRRLGELRRDWRFLLVDLRAHGESIDAPPPHTVEACADDIARLTDALLIEPAAIIGHSFGGKVALAFAQKYGQVLEQVWVLDSPPHATMGPTDQLEVERIVRQLREIPVPIADRQTVDAALRAHGHTKSLAGWMTTNLQRSPDGFVWRFDIDAVTELLSDYRGVGFDDFVRSPPAHMTVHMVRAGRSARWPARALDLLAQPQLEGRVHVLEEAGHWLHVDAPDNLRTLLSEGLTDER